jgi:DNA gyrase/topoisomerase IV subunit A
LFINNIDDKVLYKTVSENLSLLEPKYFVPKLPSSLFISSITIGYGFRSYTPPYSLYGIANLVIDYAKSQLNKKTYEIRKIAKHLKPIFPTNTYIRNYEKLYQEYKQNNFTYPIINDGIMKLEKHAIHIYNLPYDVSVSNVNKILLNNIRTKGSWANQNIVKIGDHSEKSMETHIVLYLKRTCDVFDAMLRIKSMISFTGKMTPILNYSNDGVVTNYTPFTVLRKWYKERKRAILSQKKHKQVALVKKLDKLNVILLVHDQLDRIIEIIRKNTIDDGYNIMDKEFSLTYNQCSILYNAKLSTLSKTSKEDLLQEIRDTKDELDKLLKSYNEIDKK